jgi:hypothetical protein
VATLSGPSTLDTSFVAESLSASTGMLTITDASGEQVVGSFNFSGTLVAEGTPTGEMRAAGGFISIRIH